MSFLSNHDPFAAICPSLFTQGAGGELCLRLLPVWPHLFELVNELGPLLVATKRGPITSVSRCDELDFQAIPGSSEFADTVSECVLDTNRIGAVVAVRERKAQLLMGLQFFDTNGDAVFKLLLTEASDLEAFRSLLQFFATERAEMGGQVSSKDNTNKWRPACGAPLVAAPQCALIKSLLLAYQHRFPLRFSLSSDVMHRAVTVRPCRMERCGDDFLICDCRNQVHLANVPTLRPMRGKDIRRPGTPAVLLLNLQFGEVLEIAHAGNASTLPQWEALHARVPFHEAG